VEAGKKINSGWSGGWVTILDREDAASLRTKDRTLLPSLMRFASRIFLRFDFALAKDARRGKPPL
jgi:hypothetical protein